MTTQRAFIKQSSGILGFSALDFTAPKKALLSFSSLGCLTWTFAQAHQLAAQNQYSDIEIRRIKGDPDLAKNPSLT
jgi:hypothetical protein